MKKRRLTVTILILIMLFCAGCGSTEEDAAAEKEAAEETAEEILTMEGTIETAENLPESDVVVPDYLQGDETKEFLVSEENEDATSYHLSGEEQTKAATEIAAEIEESIDEVLSNKEYYPNITGISVNEECTEFNVSFSGRDISLYENTLHLSLCIVGNKFQLYQGKPEEELMTVVHYIDESTGDEFFTADSGDIN